MDKKRVLICGAGSIGIFLGAKVYSKKHEVHLFGRRKLKAAENKRDEIYINNKKFKLPLQILKLPKKTRYDFIFITSKLYDLDKMIWLIKKNKIKGNIYVGIQNGLTDVSKYKRILKKRMIPICVFGGFRIEKNNLKSLPTSVGWLTEYSKDGKQISHFLSGCGILCRAKKNLDVFRAEKMIVNCSLNGLSAIEKKTFKQLFLKKHTRERIDKLFDECHNILKQEYPLDKKEKMKKSFFKNWHNVNHYSSTHQDLMSKRKSEIDFFNGVLVRLANKHNLNAEENQKILEEFKKLK